MKITINDRLLADYQAQLMRLRDRESDDYRVLQEQKKFNEIIVDRVRRNIRLGSTHGTNIDLDA
jgi:hypothetical protein